MVRMAGRFHWTKVSAAPGAMADRYQRPASVPRAQAHPGPWVRELAGPGGLARSRSRNSWNGETDDPGAGCGRDLRDAADAGVQRRALPRRRRYRAVGPLLRDGLWRT